MIRSLILAFALISAPVAASAETATVAVAANFVTTLEKLSARFEAGGEHDIRIVSGSTGKLYTQIIHGAPFDLFLAADAARPARLMEERAGVARQPYATGRLVLWSRKGTAPDNGLTGATLPRLAIANPDLAPYGSAAVQALAHHGLTGDARPAIVMGENVAQAIAMLATGNVDHGLVPLSIRTSEALMEAGDIQPIAAEAHDPIRQDAVLLNRGAQNPAAVAFFAFLTSDEATAIIVADGYAAEGGA